jgi:hypothetical protein
VLKQLAAGRLNKAKAERLDKALQYIENKELKTEKR